MLNIHASSKTLAFSTVFTKKIFLFAKLLKNLNVLQQIMLVKRGNLTSIKAYIYFYNNMRVAYNFKMVSSPSKSFFISLKALKLLSKRSGQSVFIISTSQGVITHRDALKLNLGGIVVGFFSY